MIKLALPFPPSVWDIYEGHGKTKHRTSAYNKWRNDCGYFLNGKNEFIDGPFSISVALKRPHKRMDLDNRMKALLDVLQHYKVIKNDNLCERLTMTWDSGLKEECVVILQRAEEALAS